VRAPIDSSPLLCVILQRLDVFILIHHVATNGPPQDMISRTGWPMKEWFKQCAFAAPTCYIGWEQSHHGDYNKLSLHLK
jgi:hypothetical protein